MANTANLDEDTLSKLSDGPAGSAKYLRLKELSLKRFKNHIQRTRKTNLSEVLKDDATLEHCLKSYFFGIRVEEMVADPQNPGKQIKTGNSVPPRLGYAKNVRSVLFGVLTKEFKASLSLKVFSLH